MSEQAPVGKSPWELDDSSVWEFADSSPLVSVGNSVLELGLEPVRIKWMEC